MRNIVLILIFCLVSIHAEDTFRIDNFKVTLFSKFEKKTVEIDTSMIFEGRYVEEYDFKIIDVLNIVIGSFYAEDLLTSKGKIGLKEAIISYAKDKHAIDIDEIYIQKLNIIKPLSDYSNIVKELKKAGCCNQQ